MEAIQDGQRSVCSAGEGVLEDLPLTPFEQFMICDDRPDSPATFYVRVLFDGVVIPVALRRAVAFASQRHPLLSARIIKKSWTLFWTFANDVSHSVEAIGDAEWDCPGFPPAIDLFREAGVRVRYGIAGEKSVVWWQFHHACCDAQGARQFAVDLMAAYARETSKSEPDVKRLDPEHLKRRAIFPRPNSTTRTTLWERLKYAFDFHTTRLSPVVPLKRDDVRKDAAGGLLFKHHVISLDDSSMIRETTRRAGVTVNDLGVSLLLQTLAQWNREHGKGTENGVLRLLIPVDLRTPADRWMPAANRIGFAFLTRRLKECADSSSLLKGVHEEMSYVKQSGVALDFVDNIRLPLSIPGALPAILRFSRCLATAVISNGDDPSRRIRRRFPLKDGRMVVGNLTLEQIVAVPPIRPGTSLAIGLSSYAGQVTIGLLADRACFDDSAAEDFLGRYIDLWQQWLITNEFFSQQETGANAA